MMDNFLRKKEKTTEEAKINERRFLIKGRKASEAWIRGYNILNEKVNFLLTISQPKTKN